MNIEVRKISTNERNAKGVSNWEQESMEKSEFSHFSEHAESFYILKGSARISSEHGQVEIEKNDYVVIPKGMECRWEVHENTIYHHHKDDAA
ncbi:cupin domain-containing protein [Sediminitomix flava]|uniref:(S)-ureidoglycine aminohydrolase cupin domain-containing protein n=1 Tax=Sediminitomix flava TaxID=379075 RepID=A0A315Z9Q6_SEDFL|nr:cupin domain-containing protein [Sediminitomix flava]PWJ42012.1 hypothetical protein BC781_103262 [Sediminitomix flava]